MAADGSGEDGSRRVADHGGLLLLSVRAALGAGRDDAAAVGGVRPERAWAWPRWSACSTTATRRSAWSPASAMDRLGPRKVVPIGAAAVGIGALLFASGNSQARERRPPSAGRRRRVRARRRGLHRHHELSRLARRHADRRDADVRHGRRLGRPVRRRTDDRRGRVVEHVLDRDGRRRAGDQRAALRAAAGVEAGRSDATTG